MAEPDFRVETPDWMKQGRDVADEWLRMQANNRAQQEQNALLPVRLKAAEQDQQLKGLTIAKEMKSRDDILKADFAAHQLGPTLSNLYQAGKPEEAMNLLLSEVAKNPDLSNSPAIHDLMTKTMTALQTKNLQQRFSEAEAGRNTRAQEANDVKLQIKGLEAELANDPNNVKTQLALMRLYNQAQSLGIAAGNLEQRTMGTELRRTTAIQGAVNTEGRLANEGLAPAPGISLMPPSAPPGNAVPASPKGSGMGQPLVVPTTRPLTSANASKLQETVMTSASALRQADKLMPLINSGTFGPAAKLSNIIVDKGLANLFPELVSEERVSANTIAAGLRAATVRALRSDSNITDAERKDLIQDVPSPDKFLTSPAEAIIQLKTINEGVVDRAIQAARNLSPGQPISGDLLDTISDSSYIKSLVRRKILTTEEAIAWSQRNLPK